MDDMRSVSPPDLSRRIETAGYYPDLVADTLEVAVGGEPITAHLVHGETTFDTDTVRRHLSVLALTGSRLVFVHADDHGDDEHGEQAHAIATSEAIPLSRVASVMITHVVPDPGQYRSGSLGREVTLTIAWGAVSRIDLEPASCGDPQCEADHGYSGTIAQEDIVIRISAEADGLQAVQDAKLFARALRAVNTGSTAPVPHTGPGLPPRPRMGVFGNRASRGHQR
jgi:hypothetical protein